MAKVYACSNPEVWGKNQDGSYKHNDIDIMERIQEDDRQLAKLLEISKKAKKERKLVGIVIGIPWADGQALYKVVQEKPLSLEHIPVGDAWDVPDYMIKGLTAKDVRQMAMTGEW